MHALFVSSYFPKSQFGSTFLLRLVLSCWATFVLSIDVSSDCSFAKRSQWEHFTSSVLQSRGLEDFGPEIVSTRTPEACHRRRAHFGRPFSIAGGCTGWRQGLPHCCCTTSNGGDNKNRCQWVSSLRTVVLWWQQDTHMGPPGFWWWQLCSARSAQECAAGPGHKWCICCDPSRRICGCMGPPG